MFSLMNAKNNLMLYLISILFLLLFLDTFCYCTGNLCPRHREIFQRNPLFAGMRLPDVRDVEPLEKRFPKFSPEVLDLMKVSHILQHWYIELLFYYSHINLLNGLFSNACDWILMTDHLLLYSFATSSSRKTVLKRRYKTSSYTMHVNFRKQFELLE